MFTLDLAACAAQPSCLMPKRASMAEVRGAEKPMMQTEMVSLNVNSVNMFGADVFESGHQEKSHRHDPHRLQNLANGGTTTGVAQRKSSLDHPSFLLAIPQIQVTDEATERERRKHRFQFSCTDSSSSELTEKQSRCKRFRKWMMRNSHRLL